MDQTALDPAFQARQEEMAEIRRLREIEKIKALRAENERRIRETFTGPPLIDQLKPGAIVPAINEAVRAAPIVGPLSEHAFNAVVSDETREGVEKYMRQARRDYPDIMGAAHIAGAVGGAAAIPSPARALTGIAGVAGRVGETAAITGADALLRGEDPVGSAIVGGGVATAAELVSPRNYNRILGGIPDEMQDYYVKNRALVKAARPEAEVSAAMAKDANRVQREISRGSGESFDILRQSGQRYPLDEVLQAIDRARGRIQQTGAFNPGDQALVKNLDELGYKIMGASRDMRTVDPEMVKHFITAFRNITKAYEKGNASIGHPPGQGYVKGVLKEADASMDQALKELVPEYGEHMRGVARATRAMQPVQRALSDETKSLQYVRRLMRGRDPEGMKALREFDAVAGTNYAQELPAAATKQFLDRPFIHGSRQVSLGKSVGEAVGSLWPGDAGKAIGGAIGSGVGAAQDIYARKVGKFLLDLSTLPGFGTAGRLLNKAAQKSPYAAVGMYRFLMERDAAFREKMDEILREDP